MPIQRRPQMGLTLIELMIAMAIGLVIVIAATVIYLSTANSQRALERKSSSMENGSFVLQLLGRDIMNAGFYPASFPPEVNDVTQKGMYDTYPPLESSPRKKTDWAHAASGWPPVAYATPVYGCDGGEFNVQTATCPAVDSKKSDSIVVNYFTSDALGDGGYRKDCTGNFVDNDPSNNARVVAGKNANIPPLLPLFVSNRYSVRSLKNFVDQQDITTNSLVCSGNGGNSFGTLSSYQPIIAGVREIRFRYGIYMDDQSLTPDKFYKASEVDALSEIVILGQHLSGWQRVTSVRVCVLSQSQGGGVRQTDKSGSEMTYTDCDDVVQKQPPGEFINRFVQIFGVRNGLKQSY